jgi:hypothetical protein
MWQQVDGDDISTFKTIVMIKRVLNKIRCFFGFHQVHKHYGFPVGYVNKNCTRDGCQWHKTVKDEAGYYEHVISKKD